MLNKLKRILKWGLMFAWLLAMLLVGGKLAQQNQDLVQLKLLAWTLPEATAGVVFGATLLMGVVLGLLAFAPGFYWLKAKLRRTEKKLRVLQNTSPTPTLPIAE